MAPAKTLLAGILFDLPADWAEFNDPVDESSPTLGTGMGHLSIAVSRWRERDQPPGTPADLAVLFAEFCDRHRLMFPPSSFRSLHAFGIGVIAPDSTDFGGAWMASDGENLAVLRYTSQSMNDMASYELQEAEQLVRSIEFVREEG